MNDAKYTKRDTKRGGEGGVEEQKRGKNECRKEEGVRIINRKKIKVASIVREKEEKKKISMLWV